MSCKCYTVSSKLDKKLQRYIKNVKIFCAGSSSQQRFVVPYELADFNGTICILREHHMFECFAESNQRKEALNALCDCYQGTAKMQKKYPRMTEQCSGMSRQTSWKYLLINYVSKLVIHYRAHKVC